ncbi:GDSL-type esterase/lipase family protein [Tumebacillus permanentifrigoris]|uniref:Lysophospholipase L1-like esterase n=1 Tax=Tumebacillus permanentifrigoris TaxID=378543 RepID=A0A316DB69_9BACL|nr:GDSL-type esterase/lipase family protein [Tumebacillus permanentifrigoris]PWK14342.1 lysophospholipase L1-like esterase [Tumebacillus permanentifrigoris]
MGILGRLHPTRLLLLLVCLTLAIPTPTLAAIHRPTLPERVDYVAIGDSITAGWGSPAIDGMRRNGFASQLHRQLLTRGPADLHNLGVPGLTSGQFLFLLDHWPEASAVIKHADLITLSLGGNDIIWTDYKSPGDTAKMRDALSKYEGNIEAILAKIRDQNPAARLFVLEVYNPFSPDDSRHQALSEYIQWANESIAMAANTHEATVVPTASLFLDHEKEYINLANNDIHPNVAGHTRIAEQISHALFGHFNRLVIAPDMKPTLLWNGKPKKLNAPLLVENDTVYLAADQVAALHKGVLKKWWFRVGLWWMHVNGQKVKLPSPVLLVDGHPYLPLRAVSLALGAKVYWIEDSQTISVMTKKE